jgi:hypothetical protein
MVIRNPCKRCLVQPICRKACENWYNYKYTQSKIKDNASYTILLVIGIEMFIWIIGQFKAPYSAIVSSTLFGLSIFQSWSVINYKKIIKHQKNRFNDPISFKFNINPKSSSKSSSVGKTRKYGGK